MRSIWAILGVGPTDDTDRIRRAYVRKLKSTNPEDDAEAFKRLRAAYEEALRRAAHRAVPVEDRAPPPQSFPAPRGAPDADTALPATERREDVRTSSHLALRDEFARLRTLLAAPDADRADLVAAFSAVCASPALEDVSVRLDLEIALAELLLAHTPRSNELIVRAAEVFGWDQRNRVLGQAPVLDAAAKCARAVKYLNELAGGEHPLSNAYRALTAAPSTFRLRAASYLFGLDKRVRQLRYHLANELALARPVLDGDAARWWTEYFDKPRLSRWMLLACALLPFVAVALVQPKLPHAMERAFVVTLAATSAAAAFKLYVIDRGRQAVQRRLAASGSLLLQFGWLPAGAGLAVLAGLDATGGSLATVAAAAGIGCALWSWLAYTVRPVGFVSSNRQILIGNVALVVWVLALLVELPAATVIAFGALALAHLIGESSLAKFWLSYCPAPARARTAPSLLAAALLLLVGLVVVPGRYDGLLAAASLIIVLLQRTVSVVMTRKQRQARYFLMWGAVPVSSFALGDVVTPTAELRLLLSWYLASCVIALSLCVIDELRQSRRTATS